ncbi:ABC-three component system middle component 6 [Zunongwangia endophytica]|uniref:ABC-three component system middle component 6 n=1 Tax=Zunongwangia endophytica TaxID=1808945 RepID=A0ABV8H7M7_9FLAO|nr:ABC-three component system middle component 6 [Zunongwangia endophytica]MDN3595300.1 hypothetical protein [Zunongwangia endophytica]
MILPTKHENLESNVLVIGADILFHLRKDNLAIEELYQKIRLEKSLNLDAYYDILTFLWMIRAIKIHKGIIIKQNDVS